jgi:hypothetical protein
LLQSVEGVQQLVAKGEPLPSFDLHVPLLSLPWAFGTTLETVPAHVPYLKPDKALVEAWRDKLATHKGRLKVGLAWAGNPANKLNRFRTMPLSTLSSLAGIENICFFSLQKGEGAEQAKNPPKGMKLVDLTDELKDFADTAALISNLDMVISVDTVVVHLAGALAKPVWTMLPFVPDWRWLLNRDDSPWYPTMRLFRQPQMGDWESVVKRTVTELRKLLPSRPAPRQAPLGSEPLFEPGPQSRKQGRRRGGKQARTA